MDVGRCGERRDLKARCAGGMVVECGKRSLVGEVAFKARLSRRSSANTDGPGLEKAASSSHALRRQLKVAVRRCVPPACDNSTEGPASRCDVAGALLGLEDRVSVRQSGRENVQKQSQRRGTAGAGRRQRGLLYHEARRRDKPRSTLAPTALRWSESGMHDASVARRDGTGGPRHRPRLGREGMTRKKNRSLTCRMECRLGRRGGSGPWRRSGSADDGDERGECWEVIGQRGLSQAGRASVKRAEGKGEMMTLRLTSLQRR
nr:hypothetical protein CFP56_24629 [Quercus suber]